MSRHLERTENAKRRATTAPIGTVIARRCGAVVRSGGIRRWSRM